MQGNMKNIKWIKGREQMAVRKPRERLSVI